MRPTLATLAAAVVLAACNTDRTGTEAADVGTDTAADIAADAAGDIGADTAPDAQADADAPDATPDIALDTALDTDVSDTPAADVSPCGPGGVPNACGGCETLAAAPGGLCGCGAGRWACEGVDALACVDAAGAPLFPDRDGDGFGVHGPLPDTAECAAGAGVVANALDCDDGRSDVVPGGPLGRCSDDADAAGLCGDDGIITWEACDSGVCRDGACLPPCTPGATRCTDDAAGVRAERCGDDGATWQELAACGEATVCIDGACLDTCEPGVDRRCGPPAALATAQVCDDDGVSWRTTRTCPPGVDCDEGRCLLEVCDNGTDDDADGAVDCDDSDCTWQLACVPDAYAPWVAYVRMVDGRERLMLQRARTTATVTIPDEIAGDLPMYPSWVPGSTSLVFLTWLFAEDRQVLRLFDVATGEWRDLELPEPCTARAWPTYAHTLDAFAVECVSDREVQVYRVGLELDTFTAVDGVAGTAPSWHAVTSPNLLVRHRGAPRRMAVVVDPFDAPTDVDLIDTERYLGGRSVFGRSNVFADDDFGVEWNDLVVDVTLGEPYIALVSRNGGPGIRYLELLSTDGEVVPITDGTTFEIQSAVSTRADFLLAPELRP